MENKDTVVKVDDLYVNFYNNNRCNKVLRGVSFELKREKSSVSWAKAAAENRSRQIPSWGFFRSSHGLSPARFTFTIREKIFGLTSSNARERRCGAGGAPDWP